MMSVTRMHRDLTGGPRAEVVTLLMCIDAMAASGVFLQEFWGCE